MSYSQKRKKVTVSKITVKNLNVPLTGKSFRETSNSGNKKVGLA